jgi:hypothetical protein
MNYATSNNFDFDGDMPLQLARFEEEADDVSGRLHLRH